MTKAKKNKLTVVDEVTSSDKMDALFEKNQGEAYEGHQPPRSRFTMDVIFKECMHFVKPSPNTKGRLFDPRLDHLGRPLPYDRKLDGWQFSIWKFEPVTDNSFQGTSEKTYDDDKHRPIDGQEATPIFNNKPEYQATVFEAGSWGQRFAKHNLVEGDRLTIEGRIECVTQEGDYPPNRRMESASVKIHIAEEQLHDGNISNEALEKLLAAI